MDVAGGHVLANVCASMQYQGVVTACGLAAGMALPATVAPFILRGVTLAGVDSVMRPRADRLVAWQRLTQELSLDKLALIGSQEVGLDEAIGLAARLLKGECAAAWWWTSTVARLTRAFTTCPSGRGVAHTVAASPGGAEIFLFFSGICHEC